MEGYDGRGGGCDSNLVRLFSRGLKIKSLKENYHTCLLLLRYCVSHSSRLIQNNYRPISGHFLSCSSGICSHLVGSIQLIVQVVLWKDC